MFSLSARNDKIYFEDIKSDDLRFILKWYNKVEDFKFATGIDKPITLNVLRQKYTEAAICSSEFFAGIFLSSCRTMIGIIKGSLKYGDKYTVWISSIVIDTKYQGKGYGTEAINLLTGYLKNKNGINSVYLAVMEENTQGIGFWSKNGFIVLRKTQSHMKICDKMQNILIMHKNI